MAFIKAQKIIYDEKGNITSGSAAIIDTKYVSTGKASHSQHVVREKLGRVLYLSEDRKQGIFLSPTRGLVEYDAKTDSFSVIEKNDSRFNSKELFPQTEIHTVFGDVYLLLDFLKNCGLLAILRSVFSKDEEYERVLCHVLHGILRDGSRISCDNFILKSFASYLFKDVPPSTLHSDSRFFSLLGDDNTKMDFFRSFVAAMQKKDPKFGKGCYVDSTPLPNDIEDNPFNALCCHGISSSDVMTRLILVLDEKTGLPVWYDIIPGNLLDINTIMFVINDVADNLGIEIDSLVLDAGYVSKNLIQTFHNGTDKTIIGRMPARKGYPYKTLYWEFKSQIGKGKYAFVRNRHAYFGVRKTIQLFDQPIYAYVYVDQNNATKRFTEYLSEHEEEYAEMKAKDKDWMMVKYGYFVLVSNRDLEPKELLTEYFGRTDIESVFKTSKEYLDLLPLSKWTDQTIRGKILHDIINTIVRLSLQKKLAVTGKSVSEIIGKSQSLMCFCNNNKIVTVETPNKQVNAYYKYFGLNVPAHIELSNYVSSLMSPIV